MPDGAQGLHLGHINRRLAALVNAFCLRLGDALELTLPAEVRLELGEHAEHVEERFAGCVARVDRLLGGFERNALGLQFVNDVLQILHGACEAVNARHDNRIALADAFEEHLQLCAAVAARAGLLLGENLQAASRFEGGLLDAEVLIGSRDARITENAGAGIRVSCVSWPECPFCF